MKKTIKYILILACCTFFANAQQVVPSGGYEVKKGITVNWILCGSLTNFTGSQFPSNHELSINQPEIVGFKVKIFPTFTSDFTTVEISPFSATKYFLELYNNIGEKINNTIKLAESTFRINLSKLPAGIYYLKVFSIDNIQSIKYEKIVKI